MVQLAADFTANKGMEQVVEKVVYVEKPVDKVTKRWGESTYCDPQLLNLFQSLDNLSCPDFHQNKFGARWSRRWFMLKSLLRRCINFLVQLATDFTSNKGF